MKASITHVPAQLYNILFMTTSIIVLNPFYLKAISMLVIQLCYLCRLILGLTNIKEYKEIVDEILSH